MEGIPSRYSGREGGGRDFGALRAHVGVSKLDSDARSRRIRKDGEVVRLMGDIWVVRHAQSLGNHAGLFIGSTDSPLSERGIAQADAVGIEIARRDIHVSRIVSSSAQRALQTATAIARALGRTGQIEVDDDIREMDYGEWEGKGFNEVGNPIATSRLFADPAFAPPGGESVEALCTRTRRAMEGYTRSSETGTVSVVVTHMGPAKASAIWALGCEESCFPRIRIDNASITRIHSSDSGSYMISTNETQHLAETRR